MSNYFSTLSDDEIIIKLKKVLPLNPGSGSNITGYNRKAAVIVPLVKRKGEWYLLFTKRTETVDHHRGEFSFPGGIIEEEDKSELDAAIRELEEEMGIKNKDVWVLGALSPEITAVSYFLIYPFVGVINPRSKMKVNPHEIERILEVPLQYLLTTKDVREEVLEQGDLRFKVYFYNYKGDIIWGATGRILRQFLEILRAQKI